MLEFFLSWLFKIDEYDLLWHEFEYLRKGLYTFPYFIEIISTKNK